MSGKVFGIIIFVIALAMALYASFASQEHITEVIKVTRFFDIMIPILAVGALIKYLFSCGGRSKDKSE